MGYYDLAREARDSVLKADSPAEKTLWRARLRECGIRVANVLVEMGELEGAGRHLSTLTSPASTAESQETREILTMEALIWLRVGDLRASRRCIAVASDLPPPSSPTTTTHNAKIEGTLAALLKLAEGDYPAAVQAWTDLHFTYRDDAMITQNLAVCLLYMGRISEARDLLTELVGESTPFHALTFNLCTLYELCTERSRDRKVGLAERVAARGKGEVGFEMEAGDFKL